MDAREKLVELIRNAHKKCKAKKTCPECEQYGNGSDCVYRFIADELLANGVTVQEWISVKDRLPEYEDKVLVCNSENGNIHTAELDGELWHLDCGWLLDVDDFNHWQHLPQPPKGE